VPGIPKIKIPNWDHAAVVEGMVIDPATHPFAEF
jgi:hypothetical protein